jgi:hypothetical protein
MQDFDQAPLEPFERYSPYGTTEDVAEFLHPYIEAGCSVFNVIPCAADDDTAIAGVAGVAALLMGSARVSSGRGSGRLVPGGVT